VDAGEESFTELVVTGGDGAKMLEFVEEALDQVALTVEDEVARQRRCPSGMRRNHRGDLPFGEDVDEGVRIVCLVADQGGWVELCEQRLCVSKIVVLSWRKHQRDRIAQCVDQSVNFGAQSAARSADRLRAVFFAAPALC